MMRRECVNFCAARSALGALACALAAALLPRTAVAQQDLLTFRLGSTPTWDTNVFRVPDTVTDPQLARGISGKSDLITTTNVGLQFNKAYAQQSLLFDIGRTATRHDKFRFLDRNAINYRSAWQWHLTPRVSGTLSADRAQSIVGFDDTQAGTLITTVSRNRNLSVDALLFGGWHLLAGTGRSERETSQSFFAVPASDQVAADFGLRYDGATRGSMTFTRRSTRGTNTGQEVDPVNFVDNAFTQQDSELRATWVTSGKSTLNGQLSRVERRHEHIPQRNFSGIAGGATYAWTPTGRLTLSVSATRAISPFATGTSATYRVDDTLAFAPVWRASDKISLNMRASRRATAFLGPVVPVAGPLQRDIVTSAQFGADWSPHPKLVLRATLQRDRRTSTDAALFFNYTAASLSATLTF